MAHSAARFTKPLSWPRCRTRENAIGLIFTMVMTCFFCLNVACVCSDVCDVCACVIGVPSLAIILQRQATQAFGRVFSSCDWTGSMCWSWIRCFCFSLCACFGFAQKIKRSVNGSPVEQTCHFRHLDVGSRVVTPMMDFWTFILDLFRCSAGTRNRVFQVFAATHVKMFLAPAWLCFWAWWLGFRCDKTL